MARPVAQGAPGRETHGAEIARALMLVRSAVTAAWVFRRGPERVTLHELNARRRALTARRAYLPGAEHSLSTGEISQIRSQYHSRCALFFCVIAVSVMFSCSLRTPPGPIHGGTAAWDRAAVWPGQTRLRQVAGRCRPRWPRTRPGDRAEHPPGRQPRRRLTLPALCPILRHRRAPRDHPPAPHRAGLRPVLWRAVDDSGYLRAVVSCAQAMSRRLAGPQPLTRHRTERRGASPRPAFEMRPVNFIILTSVN